MAKISPTEKLSDMAREWGGAILETSKEEFETKYSRVSAPYRICNGGATITYENPVKGFYLAPFSDNLGVFWSRKQVIYTGSIPWPDLVHEAAHVFASKKNPTQCDEWKFLGWEYAMAKYLGGPMADWNLFMRDYGVNQGGAAFGDLAPSQRHDLTQERLRVARNSKLVIGDVPQSIR